ncbi:hypothetical protein HYE10_03855 [Mycoplasmopsis bovis]|nr:hypothetical protein HYE10_03855 [Mycoplasmopsis bovis]
MKPKKKKRKTWEARTNQIKVKTSIKPRNTSVKTRHKTPGQGKPIT